jgi:hypothetical protein
MRDGLADHGSEILGWEEAQVNEAGKKGRAESHQSIGVKSRLRSLTGF